MNKSIDRLIKKAIKENKKALKAANREFEDSYRFSNFKNSSLSFAITFFVVVGIMIFLKLFCR